MSAADYQAAVQRIERENAAEPLLRLLRTGLSKANLIYLKAALGRLPAEIQPTEDEPRADQRAGDATLRSLWAERTQLFGEMNGLSNRFHDCSSDAERADNSKNILQTWQTILQVKARIRHYEQHGELPPSEDQYPLPDDPVALLKKLHSIRAMISQVQKEIRDLAELPDAHPDKTTRIREAENRRKHLIYYRGHAEQKINRAAV